MEERKRRKASKPRNPYLPLAVGFLVGVVTTLFISVIPHLDARMEGVVSYISAVDSRVNDLAARVERATIRKKPIQDRLPQTEYVTVNRCNIFARVRDGSVSGR